MKLIVYYLSLLILLALVCGFIIAQNITQTTMTMGTMLGVASLLVIYTIAISLVGEGKIQDERELHHRYLSNRVALICGTILIVLAIIYQLFISHQLDYWLIITLLSINVAKIITLIYVNYKK